MPMIEWKMKRLTEISHTDEEYMRMSETKEAIGQVMADREHLRRVVVDKNRSLITLQTLVRNQTAGGAAQLEIITDLKSRLDMADSKAVDLERDVALHYGIAANLRTNMDGMREKLSASNERKGYFEREVKVLMDTLASEGRAYNAVTKRVREREDHIRDLTRRLHAQESFTKCWHKQVDNLKVANDALTATLEEVTKERDLIIALSNESLDKLHNIGALVR